MLFPIVVICGNISTAAAMMQGCENLLWNMHGSELGMHRSGFLINNDVS